MQQVIRSDAERARQSAFEIYLRTGRRAARGLIEVKFNPWHDPDDGRFTFAGAGRYFPQDGESFGGAGASGGWSDYERFSPRSPRNHSIHIVTQGDTLTRIAASREGLRVSDLVWLNGLQDSNRLRIGQRLMLPTQAYLNVGRRARTNLLNLTFYVETHGGRLPPDLTRVPSIEDQLNSNWRRTTNNGFEFQIDIIERMRRARGEFTLESSESRSRRLQAEAGGKDRRQTDDGGHFVAPRFNGPREAFNHFAQDSNFNRGTYRHRGQLGQRRQGWTPRFRRHYPALRRSLGAAEQPHNRLVCRWRAKFGRIPERTEGKVKWKGTSSTSWGRC